MYKYFKILPISLIAFSLITVSSCITKEVESLSDYRIDNQSSFELRYINDISLNPITIIVPRLNTTKIEDEVYLGGGVLSADELFSWRSSDANEAIFLLRDSAGIILPAVQLNTRDKLDWQVKTIRERKSGNEYEHTLIITDDLIE